MKFFSLLLLSIGVSFTVGGELVIESTFKPEGCDSARKSVNGDTLSMHYTGSIDESSLTGIKGKEFDTSLKRGKPFEFQVGAGQVIKGWDNGLLDMCIGEKRTLTIPPELGYGAQGAGGSIPGGATLKFTVELVGFGKEKGPVPNIFAEIDTNTDGKISFDELSAWFGAREQQVPPQLFEKEDANQNQFIEWAEFSGPKGTSPPSPSAVEDDDEL